MIGFGVKHLTILTVLIMISLLAVNNITSGRDVIRISTTTSLYQIGVVDALVKDFMERSGSRTKFEVIVVGSGEALRLLSDGTACISFTHAPSIEHKYVEEGTIRRLGFLGFNAFVIVGPKEDPANVSGATDAVEAFTRIYISGESGTARFVSRGDNSGTNIRELWLWNLSGLNPKGKGWYLETGQGMQQVLIIADDIRGYTLSDVGTYLKLINSGKLRNTVALLKDAKYLVNVYSIYASNAHSCSKFLNDVNNFAGYVKGEGQKLIEERFRDLINPAEGYEDLINASWNYLAMGGR